MKKSIIISAIILGFSITANAQFGGLLNKAKDAATNKVNNAASKATSLGDLKKGLSKVAPSTNTRGMEGTWKVEGDVCNTQIPALEKQLVEQEKQYNDAYNGSTWIFTKDGSIEIKMKSGTGKVEYELAGDKINMMINNQPGEYVLQFEEGQMILTPTNTIMYVFVKG